MEPTLMNNKLDAACSKMDTLVAKADASRYTVDQAKSLMKAWAATAKGARERASQVETAAGAREGLPKGYVRGKWLSDAVELEKRIAEMQRQIDAGKTTITLDI